MDNKKILASNNSKSKEMLEAIAINKQTENLRKNKIGMLDRAKQVLNSAKNAKENAILKMKGAISDLQLKQKIKDNSKSILIGSTAFITITGGIIGYNVFKNRGVEQPTVNDSGYTQKLEDNKVEETPVEENEIEEDANSKTNKADPNQKVTNNGTVDKHGKYTNDDGTLKDAIEKTTEANDPTKNPAKTETTTGTKENKITAPSTDTKEQDQKIQADKDAGKTVESYKSTVEIGGNKVTYDIQVTTDANGNKDTNVTKKEEPVINASSKDDKNLTQKEVQQAQDVKETKVEEKKEVKTQVQQEEKVQEMSDDDLADLFK